MDHFLLQNVNVKSNFGFRYNLWWSPMIVSLYAPESLSEVLCATAVALADPPEGAELESGAR